MKKSNYFAKYLPIEGEIQEGDKFIVPTEYMSDLDLYFNNIGECTSISEEVYHYKSLCTIGGTINSGVFKKDNPQKVKLFLCSRDIQLGDKYFKEGDEFLHTEETKELVSYMSIFNTNQGEKQVPSHSLHSMPIYKVMGEISPEANWVMEGDEFEENQIKHWCNNNDVGLTVFCSQCNPVHEWYDCKKHIIKILGPCKHFH